MVNAKYIWHLCYDALSKFLFHFMFWSRIYIFCTIIAYGEYIITGFYSQIQLWIQSSTSNILALLCELHFMIVVLLLSSITCMCGSRNVRQCVCVWGGGVGGGVQAQLTEKVLTTFFKILNSEVSSSLFQGKL